MLLELLGKEHTFQTFDDSPSKRSVLARILHGPFAANEKELQRLNDQGAGIYFTVNQTDLKGRQAGNVTAVRALFVDFDTVDRGRQFNYFIKPSAIVESSPGKHHVYWFTDDFTTAEFKEYQLKLANALGGDLKIHDLPRVMRVPGFDHKKTKPFKVVEVGGCGDTYSADDLKDWIDSFSDLWSAEGIVALHKNETVIPQVAKDYTEDDPDAVKHLEALLTELAQQGEGGRNDALNKTAFVAYGLCAAGRLDYDTVTCQLIDTAISIGLEESEATTTCRSARKKAIPIPNDLDGLPMLDHESIVHDLFNTEDKFDLSIFSLTGSSERMRRNMLDRVFILGQIALLGEITVLYAKPNTGKTLLVIGMIVASIKAGNIKGDDVYYINADDSSTGVVEKIEIAEEFGGFHMLTPGDGREINGKKEVFDPRKFGKYIRKMVEDGTAKNKIIVLDTLKKFTDTMDKTTSAKFMTELRYFTSVGKGSVILLAHVNKRPDEQGNLIEAGTSDTLDDTDCAYIMQEVGTVGTIKTIEFIQKKARGGGVSDRAIYSYSIDNTLEYSEMVASVKCLTGADIVEAQGAGLLEQNKDIIDCILTGIGHGINGTRDLIKYAAEELTLGRNAVGKALKQHEGSDYSRGHRWTAEVGARGLKMYHVLNTDDIDSLDNLDNLDNLDDLSTD